MPSMLIMFMRALAGRDVMGASMWSHSEAYRSDVGAFLDRLRHEVFDRGDYYRAHDLDPRYALSEAEFVATLSPVDESGLNKYFLDDWREAQRDGRAALIGIEPTDPGSLLASQPQSGTHSIIDMSGGVAAEPADGAVAPLTEHQLVAYFDTATPSPDQVEAWVASGDWHEIRDRWQGAYVVSYVEGEPVQIHFFGYSGDADALTLTWTRCRHVFEIRDGIPVQPRDEARMPEDDG